MTFWDHDTGSVWSQPTGEAVAGPRKGDRLELLPVSFMSWGSWLETHPDTMALDTPAGVTGFTLDRMAIALDLAEDADIVVRKGAWDSYKGDNVGQGRDNTINYLLENPEVAAEIEQKVKDNLKAEANGAASSEPITIEESDADSDSASDSDTDADTDTDTDSDSETDNDKYVINENFDDVSLQ